MKQFEIFRPGTHTSAKGKTIAFSEGDVAMIAASYDPSVHEAPIVVGHPKQNLPAYGWVKSLSVQNGHLVAVPDQVEPEFSELVQAGRFKKVSAAFYAPTDKGNPTPGHLYLRHVGFLGAEPPAVKGLKSIEFAEDDESDSVEIEFNEWRAAWALDNVAGIFRRLRDFFIDTADLETANRIIPPFELDALTQTAADTRADAQVKELGPSHSFSEQQQDTDMEKTLEQRQAELDAREAALSTRETAHASKELSFSEQQTATRATEDAAFVAGIVAKGCLPIELQGTATAIFSELDESELVFSEGDEEVKTSGRAALRDLLSKLPKPVSTDEHAVGDGPDFSDPAHVQTAITAEMDAAKALGKPIDPATALSRLKKKT